MVAFPLKDPMPVERAFKGLSGVVHTVKDQNGNMYTPSLGIDQIDSLRPGRGYNMYSTKDTVFFYPKP